MQRRHHTSIVFFSTCHSHYYFLFSLLFFRNHKLLQPFYSTSQSHSLFSFSHISIIFESLLHGQNKTFFQTAISLLSFYCCLVLCLAPFFCPAPCCLICLCRCCSDRREQKISRRERKHKSQLQQLFSKKRRENFFLGYLMHVFC